MLFLRGKAQITVRHSEHPHTLSGIYYSKNKRNLSKGGYGYKIAKFLNTSVEYLVTGKESDEYKIKYEQLKSSVLDAVKD